MKFKFFVLIALVLLLFSNITAKNLPIKKPNYLFIAVDDLNDWIAPLNGHLQVKTPNIDRLAKRGITFTNAHVQAPLCNPSRTSLLSGLLPSSTGLYTLMPGVRAVPRLKDHVMLPQFLAQARFITTEPSSRTNAKKNFKNGASPARCPIHRRKSSIRLTK